MQEGQEVDIFRQTVANYEYEKAAEKTNESSPSSSKWAVILLAQS